MRAPSGVVGLLLVVAATAWAEPWPRDLPRFEDGTPVPAVFEDEAALVRVGGLPVRLRDRDVRNVVLDAPEFHGRRVLIYEEDQDGRFVRIEDWSVVDWHEIGGISMISLFGDGLSQLVIDLEAGSGTGQLLMARLIVGWCGGRYRILLAEPMSYRFGEPVQRLTSGWGWERRGTSRPSLRLRFDWTQAATANEFPFRSTTRWEDRFEWNAATCSFYDAATELRRARFAAHHLQSNLARLRMMTLASAPERLRDEWDDDAGLLGPRGLMAVFATPCDGEEAAPPPPHDPP